MAKAEKPQPERREGALAALLSKLVKVPKTEIDAQELARPKKAAPKAS